MNRLFRHGFWYLMLFIACIAQAATSDQQAASETPTRNRVTSKTTPTRNRVTSKTVGVIAGGINGTYIRIAADMAAVLDSDSWRVLAVVGKGSVQNIDDLLYLKGIDDLLYLKGIDMAIVQSDVLEYLKRKGTYKDIDKRIHYIAKLYNEEFHLLARPEITQLSDLKGRKVNFDVKGSGTAITATNLFDILNISVEPTFYDQATALEKLKNGEIAALAYVAGKPAQLFDICRQIAFPGYRSYPGSPGNLSTHLA